MNATTKTEDEIVATAIAEVLATSGPVAADKIFATVVAGHVTLQGVVDGWSERDTIERAVHTVPGVRTLENLVTVDPEAISREMECAITEASACPS